MSYFALCGSKVRLWLHAERVERALAVTAKALSARSASSRKRAFSAESARYDFRVFLLHLGMIGEEFKTARAHLIERMPGNAAFKNGRPRPEPPATPETGNAIQPDAMMQAAQA